MPIAGALLAVFPVGYIYLMGDYNGLSMVPLTTGGPQVTDAGRR